MKRAGRWIFNLATGVSAVFCIASFTFGVRSYFRTTSIEYGSTVDSNLTQFHLELRSDAGLLVMDRDFFRFSIPADWTNYRIGFHVEESPNPGRVDLLAGARDHGFALWGFAYFGGLPDRFPATGPWDWEIGGTRIAIPYWALVLLFAPVPARSIFVMRRSRVRKLRVQCVSCGYDLRATPDRCPECGTVVEQKAGAVDGQQSRTEV